MKAHLPDLIPRWVRHADRMSSKDLQIATYVHVRIMEVQMADLKQVVDDLVRAVQGVIDRIGNSGSDLQQALADAKAANEQLQAAYDKQMSDDAIEDADFQTQIADLQGQLATANGTISDSANAIVQATAQLDQIGTTADTTPIPTTPPTDEAPMGEPADPTGGAGTGDTGNLPPRRPRPARATRPRPPRPRRGRPLSAEEVAAPAAPAAAAAFRPVPAGAVCCPTAWARDEGGRHAHSTAPRAGRAAHDRPGRTTPTPLPSRPPTRATTTRSPPPPRRLPRRSPACTAGTSTRRSRTGRTR